MKTKLLKIIRKDRRFTISKKGIVKGYNYSGWWYLHDMQLNLSTRNKSLKPILKEYLRMLTFRNQMKIYRALFFGLGIVLTMILFTGCDEERIEMWPEKSVLTDQDSIQIRQQEKIYLMETGLTQRQAEARIDSSLKNNYNETEN